MKNILIQVFIESYDKPPKELILDFDGTDDKVHGNQIGELYHGYYLRRCFLPLYVFCGNHLLTAYLPPGNNSDSKQSWAILKLLVNKSRSNWPGMNITFRGDSAFCRHDMFNWCDRNDTRYIVGIPSNNHLFSKTSKKQRFFGEFKYAAKTCNKKRRVIVKAEYNIHGLKLRYIVTNLSNNRKMLYDKVYCVSGEMENRIKEQQLCLFSDRTSSKNWLTNQFRLLLASRAYTLLEATRRIALKKLS